MNNFFDFWIFLSEEEKKKENGIVYWLHFFFLHFLVKERREGKKTNFDGLRENENRRRQFSFSKVVNFYETNLLSPHSSATVEMIFLESHENKLWAGFFFLFTLLEIWMLLFLKQNVRWFKNKKEKILLRPRKTPPPLPLFFRRIEKKRQFDFC